MKILVTGASGNLGSKIIESLQQLSPQHDIIAGVRQLTNEKAQAYEKQGIEVRMTNFDDVDSLKHAFQQIDRLFIISTFGDFDTVMQQQTNAIAAAKEAGVKHVYYPSVTKANSGDDFFLAQTHYAREIALVDSGIPYTILRNNWYVENELPAVESALNGAPWVTSAPNGKIGWVYRPDLAEATANVLVSEGHENKIYELSGTSFTQQQFVDIVNETFNTSIPLLAVTTEEHQHLLSQAGVPEDYIPMLLMTQQAIQKNCLHLDHSDLTTLLGHEPTSIHAALNLLIKK